MNSSGLRVCTVAALLVLLSLGLAVAEPVRLTVDDAIARARTANAALLASGSSVVTARANVERSHFWVPQNPYLNGGLLQTPGTGGAPSYGFSISQEFEIAGQRSRRIAVAEAGLRKAEWEQKNEALDLTANVKTTFAHALIGEERVALAKRGMDLVSDLGGREEKGNGESHAGMVIDRNQLLIQEARSRKEVRSAEAERDESIDSLRYLLGLPVGQEIELVGSVDRTVKPLPSDQELIARAIEHRPDLIAQQADADRADKQVPLVKREAIPNLTLAGNYSRFLGDDFAGGDVSFYLPVLRSSAPELLDALADRDRTQHEVDDLQRTIERDVRQARRICVAAGEDLEITQDAIMPRSRENLELQNKRFEHGEVGAAELIGMLIDDQVAEKEYLDAVQAYSDAWIELERTIGGDL